MNFRIPLLWGVFILLLPYISFSQCPTLLWSDEFDGTSLNTSDWNYETGGGGFGNNELQYYTNRSNNLSVGNGKLTITALKENYMSNQYTSAKITSAGKHYFTYGRFEARIKLPRTQGLWPAFWMMPQNSVYGGWPASGEIDIMEGLGGNPYKTFGTIHYGANVSQHKYTGDTYTGVSDLSQDFHVYAVEWEPDTLKWFIDNHLFLTLKTSDIAPDNWPFDKDFFMILNLAVGGWFGGNPDGTTVFPQTLEVDYVRVYSNPYTLLIDGKERVIEGSTHTYSVINGTADSYHWTIPSGSTIVSGQDTKSITILWGSNSGSVSVDYTHGSCGTSSLTEAVEVIPNTCDLIFNDFESKQYISYNTSTGTSYNPSSANPNPSSVNNSNTVTYYRRNTIQYDLFYYNVDIITNSTEYEKGNSVLYMDMYTDAPVGSVINWQFENKARVANDYPSGRRAVFVGTTTVQNQWERIKFSLASIPDPATAPTSIDQFTFLFRPNTYNAYNFYFDNLMRRDVKNCGTTNTLPEYKHQVLISPNPAHGKLNISMPSVNGNSTQFVLIDMLGKEVMQKGLNSSSAIVNEELNISNLQPGVYVLYIRQGDQLISSEKIILY